MSQKRLAIKAIDQLFAPQTLKPVENTDLAQFILTHTNNGPSVIGKSLAAQQVAGAETEKPSFLSHIFDSLSSGLYATSNIAHDLVQTVHDAPQNNPSGNPIESILQGIGAGAKSVGSNVLGAGMRSLTDAMQAAGQATGFDQAPLIGKPIQAVEHGLQSGADNLSPRRMGSTNLGDLGIKNKAAKYGGGFALDVAMDPITYVPGLDIISTIKKAREAKLAAQGMNAAEHVTPHVAQTAGEALDNAAANVPSVDVFKKSSNPLVQPPAEMALGKSMIPAHVPPPVANPNISNKPGLLQSVLGNAQQDPTNLIELKKLRNVDNAKRAANVRWGKPIDWHDIPDMTPQDKAAVADMFREGKMRKAGIVSDGKGNVSTGAVTDVLQKIKNGEIARFAPDTPSATGEAASRAMQLADQRVARMAKQTDRGRWGPKELTPRDQANLFNDMRNAAADIVNKQFASRPVRVLNPKQQQAADSIKTWLKGTKQAPNRAVIEKELAAQVAKKTINKADAKAIVRDFFPPEPIRNFAATRMGRQQVNELARSMHKTAEDRLINTHQVSPVYWNGMRAKLSDVIAEVGPSATNEHLTKVMDAFVNRSTRHISDPGVQEAINKALARRSLSMADLLGELSKRTLDAKASILDGTAKDAAEAFKRMPQEAKQAVLDRGATNAEGNSIKAHIYSLLHSTDTPVDSVMADNSRSMAEATVAGKISHDAVAKVNDSINRTLDMTPRQLSTDITGHKLIDGIFTRFSTTYGRQLELKRFTQDAFLHGELNAIDRTILLRHLSKAYTPDQLNKAFMYAKLPGKVGEVGLAAESDPLVVEASQIFSKYFDWMLGKDTVADSVASKSQMDMKLVNKHLKAIKSRFQFTDARKVVVNGIDRNYSPSGEGWVRSWEAADHKLTGQDPISLMHDIDLAMQRAIAENSFYDEAARVFGAKVGDAHYNPDIHQWTVPETVTQRLSGYYFHPEIRNQLMRMIHDLEQGAWSPKSAAMRNIVQATRVWKSSVTIYHPIHHIRNLLGDSYNTWLAGYNDPGLYRKAAKVLLSQKPRYAEALRPDLSKMDPMAAIDNLKGILDKKAVKAFDPNPEVRMDAIIHTNKKTGLQLDAHQLWTSAYDRGLLLKYNKTEDLFGETPMGAIFGTSPEKSVRDRLLAPFGGRAHHVAATTSEHREHYVRMAHYIGAVDKFLTKYGSKDMNKVFDDAAHEVRQWHPDGSDLTQFEQRARILVPFYAWTRKEIPLLVQTMVTRPAKIVAPARAERAIAGASGINVNENQGMLDPFPNDQLFPDWIRASGIGPIGDPQSTNAVARFWAKFAATTTNGAGQPMGYSIINPSNPFNDTAQQLFGSGQTPQNSLQGMLNSLNPGVQIPAQLAFNQTFSGAPITKDAGGLGLGAYLTSQVPQASVFTRLTGVGKDTNANTNNQNEQNIINFLTALGIRGSGPYIKSAEFEAKARAKNANANKQ